MADIRFTISKLNNSNYEAWKCKAELLLIKEDLWHTVSAPRPVTPDKKWIKEDMQARATIGLLLEDDQLSYIKNTTSAKEAWESLRTYHEKAPLSNSIYLLKRLCAIKLSENGDMKEHLSIMLYIADQLAEIGQPLNENVLIAMVLCSLPASYNTLAIALETRTGDELTLDLVKEALLNEHQIRKISQYNSNQDIALKVHSKYSNHATKASTLNRMTCYLCNKQGHLTKDCPEYQRWKLSKEVANQARERTTEEQEISFNVQTKQGEGKGMYYIDSETTSHMMQDQTYFKTLGIESIKQAEKEEEEPSRIWCADSDTASPVLHEKSCFDALRMENIKQEKVEEEEELSKMWYTDSGAASHITHDRNIVNTSRTEREEKEVQIKKEEQSVDSIPRDQNLKPVKGLRGVRGKWRVIRTGLRGRPRRVYTG